MVRWKFGALILLMGAAPFLIAMGGGGEGGPSDTIPRPKENYRADLSDRQGVRTQVEHLSCDGRTFFPLARGGGMLMVPFSKVQKAVMGAEAGAQVRVRIEVESGSGIEGSLPRSLVCTGETEYGSFKIEVRGIQEIDFARP